MAQTEKKRDFKVLAEKIAPDNVLIMAELLAIKETKKLVKFMGQHAIRAHATLCADVFCKDMPDYTLSDKAIIPAAASSSSSRWKATTASPVCAMSSTPMN